MTEIRDHWWWRPGWAPGRRFWTFHVTWQDVPEVQEHMAKARARLAGVPGLDLVPGEWLHLTTQGVGFDGEVGAADLSAIVAAVRARLAAILPVPVEVGPPVAASEGVACWVGPARALDTVRDALRAAIADVRGLERLPESPDWTPHISAAYSSVTGPADTVEAALGGEDGTAHTTVKAVQLIRLGRDRRAYEWDSAVTLPLGGQ